MMPSACGFAAGAAPKPLVVAPKPPPNPLAGEVLPKEPLEGKRVGVREMPFGDVC